MDNLLTTLDPVITALRPYLQPITHNLPHPLRDFAISLFGESCYKRLILDVAPTPACTSLAISKALGIAIISASSIVKVPQLLKLLQSKSAAGLSFPAYLLETASFAISLAYGARSGFPFSTYGESALIAAQNVVIAALILHLSGKSTGAAAFVAGIAGAGYALANDNIVSMDLLRQLMAAAGAMAVASKVPQILTIYQQGGTGQLSAFAVSKALTLLRNRS
jgi:mannose-P-dolichol utilization defect 1